jgi:hypothetical protein
MSDPLVDKGSSLGECLANLTAFVANLVMGEAKGSHAGKDVRPVASSIPGLRGGVR